MKKECEQETFLEMEPIFVYVNTKSGSRGRLLAELCQRCLSGNNSEIKQPSIYRLCKLFHSQHKHMNRKELKSENMSHHSFSWNHLNEAVLLEIQFTFWQELLLKK